MECERVDATQECVWWKKATLLEETSKYILKVDWSLHTPTLTHKGFRIFRFSLVRNPSARRPELLLLQRDSVRDMDTVLPSFPIFWNPIRALLRNSRAEMSANCSTNTLRRNTDA